MAYNKLSLVNSTNPTLDSSFVTAATTTTTTTSRTTADSGTATESANFGDSSTSSL